MYVRYSREIASGGMADSSRSWTHLRHEKDVCIYVAYTPWNIAPERVGFPIILLIRVLYVRSIEQNFSSLIMLEERSNHFDSLHTLVRFTISSRSEDNIICSC